MKKIVFLGFVSLVLLPTTVVIDFLVPVEAEPKTWTVDDDGPADFHTIREAINAATSGDLVLVNSGTYQEWDIVLDKDGLSLIGENRDNTVIDGMNYGWILIIAAQNVTVTGFTIQNSPGGTAGVFLNHAAKSKISDNLIRNHDSGVYSIFSSYNVIEYNLISDNYAGVILSSYCKDNKISNNDVIGNIRGIDLTHHAHNNEIRNNKIFRNTYGVSISFDNNSILDNQIINNNVGIYEDLLIGSAQGYTIFHNNFINNTKQIDLRSQSANMLDNGLEGNFWSSYNATDSDQDGIGDTPNVINANNADHFPLMGMFSDFPVTLEEKNYHVTTISNSSISTFQFSRVDTLIKFNVAGEEGIGFCRVCVPYDLMSPPYTVTIDDGQAEILYFNHNLHNNGTHIWIYFTYQHSTHTVTIQGSDAAPPIISILSPENKTYPLNEVLLIFTVDKINDWIGYSLDEQANVTITGNTTLSGLSDESHTLKVYARDIYGNTGVSETIHFSIKTPRTESLSTWIVATILLIAAVGAAILIYFTKVKKLRKSNNRVFTRIFHFLWSFQTAATSQIKLLVLREMLTKFWLNQRPAFPVAMHSEKYLFVIH